MELQIHLWILHRGLILEIDKPETERQSGSVSLLSVNLPIEKAGRSGGLRLTVSLFNITTTADIVGLSDASSWTHKSPICTYLRNSSLLNESINKGSISSNAFPSFHSFHACTMIQWVYRSFFTAMWTSEVWSWLKTNKLTYARRLEAHFDWWKPAFPFPDMISSKSTPKLNTSDLIEYIPPIAYSGAMYPLYKI